MQAVHEVDSPAELLGFLLACHPDIKRSRMQQWLKYGAVQVNGRPVTQFNHRLRPGDTVAIQSGRDTRSGALLPRGMRIVFEDASLIVINKPAGLLSISTDRERQKTAYAHLTSYVRRGNPHSRQRVWIVHRLDRETSGLMVFARTELPKRTLQSNCITTEKRYLAVVEAHPPHADGVLTSHLDESGPYKVFSAPESEKTRHAVTQYRVLRRTAQLSLLELIPETGRRNQIRVHLADAGWPIVGDQKYGAQTNAVRRLALHAAFLGFTHPATGKRLRFESKLPGKLARIV